MSTTSRQNPVLQEFREESDALGRMYPRDWLRVCRREFWGDEATKEDLRQARAVLTRLVNLDRQGAAHRSTDPHVDHTNGSEHA